MTFTIKRVETGADAHYPEGSVNPVLSKWMEVTVRIPSDFDWPKEGPGLLKRLQKQAEINLEE